LAEFRRSDKKIMAIPEKRNGSPKPLALEGEEPVKIVRGWVIADKIIRCGHCEGVVFKKRNLMMNTRGLTFLGWDWMNEVSALFAY